MRNFYRVYSTYHTNYGIDKSDIRLFWDIDSARRYAARLAGEVAGEALQSDDTLTVEIEDLTTGGTVCFWQFEGEIVSVFTDGMWEERGTRSLIRKERISE